MKSKKMTDLFEYCHNPEKGVCVAFIKPENLTHLVSQEQAHFTEFLAKKLHESYYHYPKFRICPCPKLVARAVCNFEAGDTYSYEIGEKIAGARLRLRVLEYLWSAFDRYMDSLEKLFQVAETYNDEFMYRYANAQKLALKALHNED